MSPRTSAWLASADRRTSAATSGSETPPPGAPRPPLPLPPFPPAQPTASNTMPSVERSFQFMMSSPVSRSELTLRPLQAERLREKDGHLAPRQRGIGAVVPRPAPAGNARRRQGLDVLE